MQAQAPLGIHPVPDVSLFVVMTTCGGLLGGKSAEYEISAANPALEAGTSVPPSHTLLQCRKSTSITSSVLTSRFMFYCLVL